MKTAIELLSVLLIGWHFFQGVRGALFAAAFVLLAIPLVFTRR